MGSAKVANVVMLAALLEETECMPMDSAIAVLEETVKNPKLLELDRQAIAAGRDYVDTKIEVGSVVPAGRLLVLVWPSAAKSPPLTNVGGGYFHPHTPA